MPGGPGWYSVVEELVRSGYLSVGFDPELFRSGCEQKRVLLLGGFVPRFEDLLKAGEDAEIDTDKAGFVAFQTWKTGIGLFGVGVGADRQGFRRLQRGLCRYCWWDRRVWIGRN